MFLVGIVISLLGLGSYLAAAPPTAGQAAMRSTSEGVYSDEQAKRGMSLYLDECARCHGESLGGGDFGPAIAGDSFFGTWNGKTLHDVFDKVYTTMPLDSPGRLSRQQYADLVAYMLQVSHAPSGAQMLTADAPQLKAIQVEWAKPKH